MGNDKIEEQKGKRGKAEREGRDDAAAANRLERRKRRGTSETADWSSASSSLVVAAIRAVAARGGALRFGYTRDFGAFAVGIYDGEESTTEYIRPSENIDFYLQGLAEDYVAF
jgi:hypothetical protein